MHKSKEKTEDNFRKEAVDLLTRGIIENGKTIPPYSIHDQNHLMVVTQKTCEFCSEICHIVDQMKILIHLVDCNR